MRSRAPLSVALVALVTACGSAPAETTAESEEAVTYIGGFAPSYWQIDTAHPSAGEVTVLSVTDKTFWGDRCADDACVTPDAISGSYKRSKTRLYLYDAKHVRIGTFAYTLQGTTLKLREIGTSTRYALDPMSESACDASGGAWSDDDLAAHGFNCTCPGGGDWGPMGCAAPACAAPSALCGGACVDLATDRNNCGACGSTCTKAQTCLKGACQ